MLSDNDRREIDERIANKLEADGIVAQFAGMDEKSKEAIAADLSRFMFDRQQKLKTPDNTYTPRYLLNGQDINNSTYGLTGVQDQAGHAAPTLPQVINLEGFQARIHQPETNQLDLKALGQGAGSDCLFDYLVSSCFASLSGFTEGQTYASLSGCTFKGYSTIQGALTYHTSLSTTAGVLAICGGTYAEKLTVGGGPLSIYGSGRDRVKIQPAAGQTGIIVDAQAMDSALQIDNLTIDTSLMSSATGFNGLHSGAALRMFRVKIDCTGGNGLNTTATGGAWHFIEVEFSGTAGTGMAIVNAGVCDFVFDTCVFGASLTHGLKTENATDIRVDNCWFYSAIGIFLDATFGQQNGGRIEISSYFSGCTTGVKINSGSQGSTDVTIEASQFYGNAIGVDASSLSAVATKLVNVENCWFDSNATGTRIGVKLDSTLFQNSLVMGNTFKGYNAGNEVSGITLAQAITAGVQITHNATDSGTPILDSGLGHAGSGTGMAAPNSSTFLTVTDEHVNLPNSRQLTTTTATAVGGVAYKDNGAASTGLLTLADLTAAWTQAGVFDISTAGNLTVLKHVAIGASSSIAAGSIVSVQETFTDPAATSTGITASAQLTMTAGNAQAFRAFATATSLSGAFTHSGIVSNILSAITASTNGMTVADARNYDATLTLAAGSTVTDRYGIRVRNATGGSGALTNQYGVYIENMAKGGTLNRAIQSLGGISTHLGSFSIGSNTAPNASAILDLSNAANLALLLPQVATASLPTPVNGELVYDTTTATTKAYAGSNYYNLTHLHEALIVVDGTLTTQKTGVRVPIAGTITNVTCKTNDGVTIGATAWVGTIYKVTSANIDTDGGTTEIFVTRPTITNGHMAQNYGVPDSITSVAAGDWLIGATTQIGTSATAVSMGVEIRY